MVFRPPARETIELLRSILQKLESETETKSSDLAYLRCAILERITELEAVQRFEPGGAEIPASHSKAA